jgi:hypothetical protein
MRGHEHNWREDRSRAQQRAFFCFSPKKAYNIKSILTYICISLLQLQRYSYKIAVNIGLSIVYVVMECYIFFTPSPRTDTECPQERSQLKESGDWDETKNVALQYLHTKP